MATDASDSKAFPSLVSLYILQKVAKSGIYPSSGLFIYAYKNGSYGGAYGPEGTRFDVPETGVKIIDEVHQQNADLTSPYVGRLKNHLLKVFPVAPAGDEFLGVMIRRETQFDNVYLDMLLYSYIQELRSFYDTQEVDSNLQAVDECQDVLFAQSIQQKREVRGLQAELDELRMRVEEERVHFSEREKQLSGEKERIEAELADVRGHCERLLTAAAAPAAAHADPELSRVKSALTATASELEAERIRAARGREAEQTAIERAQMIDADLTQTKGELSRLQAEYARVEELLETVKTSRDKFRDMVDSFPIGVIVHQELHQIQSLNAAMRVYVVQNTFNEAVGQKCYESIGMRLPCPGCPVEKSFADGEVHEEEISFPVKDIQRHFRVIGIPSKDASGRSESVMEYFEDVSERVGVINQMSRLHQETDRLKKQIELQSPDTLQRLIDRLMAVEREKKRLEIAAMRDHGLVENLRRANSELRTFIQRENDLRHKAVRLVNVAKNLEASKMHVMKKFGRLHSYVLDLLS